MAWYRRVTGLVVGAFALLLVSVPGSLAGSEPDPNTGDTILGTAGGLRYARDRVPFDLGNNGYGSVATGCGGSASHDVGGGLQLKGGSTQGRAFQTSAPDDWYDTDSTPDDGWRGSGRSGSAGHLYVFSICTTNSHTHYHVDTVPNSPVGGHQRAAQADCAAGEGHVVGGGGQIATTGSFIRQSFPEVVGGDNGWRIKVYDTVAGGIGGMSVDGICQPGPVHYPIATTELAAHHGGSTRALCPPGTHVAGGGGQEDGSGDVVHLAGAYPIDTGDSDHIPDDGFKAIGYNGTGLQQTLKAYAVCLG